MKKLLFLSVGVFLSLFLAGCGDDDEEKNDALLDRLWNLVEYSQASGSVSQLSDGYVCLSFTSNGKVKVTCSDESNSRLFMPSGIYNYKHTSDKITIGETTFTYKIENSNRLHIYNSQTSSDGIVEYLFISNKGECGTE